MIAGPELPATTGLAAGGPESVEFQLVAPLPAFGRHSALSQSIGSNRNGVAAGTGESNWLAIYFSLNESPVRILPPSRTEAYTPTFTWLCCAAVRRIPESLGKLPCASVVITQRAQLRSILSRTPSPIVTIRP